MRFIKSSFEILDQEPGLDGIYKQIELAGRVSYKSEDKITENSAKNFVDMLIKKGHTSPLEHGTIYLYIPKEKSYGDTLMKYQFNPYSVVKEYNNNYYITTNYRVLFNGDKLRLNWFDDLQYLCEPTEYHEKRVTVRFILPISISREFIRHKILCVA